MRTFKRNWLTATVLAASAFGLVYCGKPVLQPSNSKSTESQAQADLELRLTRTREIQAQLGTVRDALRPVEAVLNDLGKAIDLKIEGKAGGALGRALERIQDNIKQVSKGLAKKSETDSWMIEQPSPLALLPESSGCRESKIQLVGKRITGGEEITLSASGCSSPELEKLALIRVGQDGSREITLSAASFAVEHHENMSLEPCKLKIEHDIVDLHCEPMEIKSGSQYVLINRLDFSQAPETGTRANVAVSVHELRMDQGTITTLGTGSIKVEPNKAAEIRLCLKGESCVE